MTERMGMVIGLNADAIEEYKALHADVWPGVLSRLKQSNISNYSIFLNEPENLMFSYWEYTGTDFDADMAAIAADETTQKWWRICGPLQRPLDSRAEGEWWARMEQVFYMP